MPSDILITPRSGVPQILFRGSGNNDSSIELNVLSSYQSSSGSGTALLFEGNDGQLFAITDNLSSGVIFGVGDITGLPLFEIDSSGVMYLSEYGSNIRAYRALELFPSGTTTGQTNELRYYELASNGSNYVGFKAPNSISSNVVWTLPSADGSSNQVLQTNGAGTLSWGAGGGGGGITGLTTNYVTKASSSTTIANSQIFDNGTNIGIGTTSPGHTLDVVGTIRAERYRGINSLTLNSYATANPASNVFLYSQSNDRDAWIFLDSADLGTNWGIYHRQIDSTVLNLPANSIGFIGGGTSALQSYISLANGNAYFAGNVGVGNTAPVAKLHVDAGTNTTKGEIIRGAASQTANLTEWQNSAGTILTSVDPTGNIRFDSASLTSSISGLLYLNTDRKIANASNIRYKPDVASPGLIFTPSGSITPPVTLNLLTNATNSISGVATLSFEGSAGQLFSITDQLASGTIFSVNDIGGLPLIEADASGMVRLGRYGEDVLVYKNLNIQNTYSIKENIMGVVSGTGVTINLASGNYVIATTNGNTTWRVSGVPNGEAVGFILQLTSGGLYTQTWPSGVRWPGGNAPALTASGTDVLTFITTDFGSSFRAVLSMQDSK